MQIPVELRRLMGVADGDAVLMELVGNELHVRPLKDVLSKVQARLKGYVPENVSLSDDLIIERRKAAEHE